MKVVLLSIHIWLKQQVNLVALLKRNAGCTEVAVGQ